MKLDKPTIVLFDMDGTTVRHINPHMLGFLERIDDGMFKITTWLHRNKPQPDFSRDKDTNPHLLVHRALHSMRRKPVEQIVQPCPGIYTLLDMFRAQGIPIGIVSNGLGTGYGHDILTKFNLSHYFTAQVFREDIGRSKPHPDPILRALEKIKDPLSDNDVIWYIGDRHKDVLAAIAADKVLKAHVIPFSYGIKGAVALLETGQSPEQVIMNYTDFASRIYPVLTQHTSPSSAWE